MNDKNIPTELNGEFTVLTEEEIELLLEFRMSNNKERAKILKLIKKGKNRII